MTVHARSPVPIDDRLASLIVVFAFSMGLGVATVAIPLLALEAGYDPAAIGLLVATSAACQFAVRLGLPWLLGRFPDRRLTGVSSLSMVAAFGLLVASTSLPVFLVAQLLQGAARAIFWTSSQTHAVRSGGPPVRRLVDMNIAGNAGTLVGPALGGMLAVVGLEAALAVAMAAGATAAVGSIWLADLPPYDRRGSAGTLHLLRREGVDVACWASTVGGAWWSMLGSYVPVIGIGAGLGTASVGWLITLSEGAGMLAIIGLRRVQPERIGRLVRAAAFTTTAALIALALAAMTATAAFAAVFAGAMLVGGAANGANLALSPALANRAAAPGEQGDALALTGTFRAGALLVAPGTVGVLLAVAAVPVAIIVVSIGLGLPGVLVGRAGGRSSP